MTLPVKITLLLGFILVVFICVHSAFLYGQINQNYHNQAEQHMILCTSLVQNRVEFLRQNLLSEMQQLSASLFTENETVLASMLKDPPEYNADVVHFAELLRRRTTLDFLTVLSAEGTVLSSSEHPAAFGGPDAFADFPADQPSGLKQDGLPRLALQKAATFGSRRLILRGGYFLESQLKGLTFPGMDVAIRTGATPAAQPPAPAEFTRVITLKDYRNAPLILIAASFSPDELLRQRRTVIYNSVLLFVISFLLCLTLAHLLSRWISRPLGELNEAAVLMSSGRLDVRVTENAGGEIGDLINAFNDMARQLEEKQRRLAQSERIAAWQEIARHLAHEIKNPLTPIRTSIANLRLALEKAPQKFPEIFLESSGSVLEEVEKLRRLADEFSRFARLPAPALRTADLNEVIRQCLVLYRDHPGVEIEFRPGELPPFSMDTDQISEVIHNLLRNAIEAMPGGGRISVATSSEATLQSRQVLLSIEDTGPGMDEETRRQIFVPYFTTKASGTGLGLAIVQRIIVEHRGRIAAESSPGRGTRFEIRFEI